MRSTLQILGLSAGGGLCALILSACGDAGDDDARRAAQEAGDAAQSAGEAVEQSWESGEDERAALAEDGAALAEESGERLKAVTARVRSEWDETRSEREAVLETAGDHAAAAGSAVTEGFDAAVAAYTEGLQARRQASDAAPDPCVAHDRETCNHTEEEHARCRLEQQ
ncbi:hypothetical protein ACWCOP_12925 [Maricaulaceae bacterium MS644]